MESGKISYLVSTSAKGMIHSLGTVKVRRRAAALGIPCFTSLDTAAALPDLLHDSFDPDAVEPVEIVALRNG